MTGILFAGYLDSNEFCRTDRISIAIGLEISLAFADGLDVGAVLAFTDGQQLGSRYAATTLMLTTIVWSLGVAGPADIQVEKSIKNFAWMTESICDLVYASWIDMKWGIAQASLAYLSMIPRRE